MFVTHKEFTFFHLNLGFYLLFCLVLCECVGVCTGVHVSVS